MSDTPISDLANLLIIQECVLSRLHTLAREWHGKHITDARFASRVYEEIYRYERDIAKFDSPHAAGDDVPEEKKCD